MVREGSGVGWLLLLLLLLLLFGLVYLIHYLSFVKFNDCTSVEIFVRSIVSKEIFLKIKDENIITRKINIHDLPRAVT